MQQRGLMHAQKHGGLQVHGDERRAVFLACEPAGEGGDGGEHEIDLSAALNSREIRLHGLRGEVEDDLRAVTKLPDARITNHGLKLIFFAEWHEVQACLARMLLKQTRRDHRYAVPACHEMTP